MTLIARGLRDFAERPLDTDRLEALEIWKQLPQTYKIALMRSLKGESVPDYTLSRARKRLNQIMEDHYAVSNATS